MNGDDAQARDRLIDIARLLVASNLAHGSTGNISTRTDAGILITPTGLSLRSVTAEQLSLIDVSGAHLDGPAPSKEAFLHAAIMRARPDDHCVIHTHSTYSTAVSCLADLDDDDAIKPITAYFVMHVGRVARLPYHAPGDDRLQVVAEDRARRYSALLLSNHGPVVAAPKLSTAYETLVELEETAKLTLLLRGIGIRALTQAIGDPPK